MTDIEILKEFLKEHGPIEYDSERSMNYKKRGFGSGFVCQFKSCVDTWTPSCEAISIACQWLEGELLKNHAIELFFDKGVTDIRIYAHGESDLAFSNSYGSKLEALIETWKAVCCGW